MIKYKNHKVQCKKCTFILCVLLFFWFLTLFSAEIVSSLILCRFSISPFPAKRKHFHLKLSFSVLCLNSLVVKKHRFGSSWKKILVTHTFRRAVSLTFQNTQNFVFFLYISRLQQSFLNHQLRSTYSRLEQ